MSRTIHRSLLVVVASVAFAPAACGSSLTGASPDGDEPRADATSEVGADDADTIPCAPRAILETVCQKCHARPPRNGAPFSLVTRSDVVRVSSDGEIRLLMIPQLESKRMPLFPETLDDPGRTVLLDWLRAGAPAVSPRSCAAAPPGTDAGDAPKIDAPADGSTTSDAGAADVCTLDSEADQ